MGALGIVLLAVGAVLAFAVNVGVDGVDLRAVGVILMVAGGLGVILSAVRGSFMGFTTRTERVVSPDGREVVEERHTTSD